MKTLIMCIGNRFGGDDSVGPYIADNLRKIQNIHVIDCGIIPENYTSIVKKLNPEKLIIIDAADMNLSPGEIRIISKEKICKMHISTHNIPISLLINYLEKFIKKIYFIGVQPKKMFGKISPEVKKSADFLAELLIEEKIENIKKVD